MVRIQQIRNVLLASLVAIGMTSTAFAQTSASNAVKVYRNGSTTITAQRGATQVDATQTTDTICNTYNCGGGRRS